MSILAGVLAERGKADAVLECEASEGEGSEDLGGLRAVGLRVGCGAGLDLLVGGEVADSGLGLVLDADELWIERHGGGLRVERVTSWK